MRAAKTALGQMVAAFFSYLLLGNFIIVLVASETSYRYKRGVFAPLWGIGFMINQRGLR